MLNVDGVLKVLNDWLDDDRVDGVLTVLLVEIVDSESVLLVESDDVLSELTLKVL